MRHFKRLDERGDVLSAILIFPFLLLMIYMVLQIWFWSTSSTVAQIAVDEGARAAQAAAADNSLSDAEIAQAGVNASLAELQDTVSFVVPAREGYQPCGQSGTSRIQTQNEACPVADAPTCGSSNDLLTEVSVDSEQIVSCVGVNVFSLFGGLTPSRIETAVCAPRSLTSWAPNRLTTNIEDTSNPDETDTWGDAWSCSN